MSLKIGDRVKVLDDKYRLGVYDYTGMTGTIFHIQYRLICVEFKDGSISSFFEDEIILEGGTT